MKIEIELKELEALRQETSNYRKELEETQQKLKELEEKTDAAELKEKAIDLAEKLTQKYLETILRGIGFKDTCSNFIFGENALNFDRSFSERQFGETWYRNEEDLKITIGTNISNAFRKAYVRIGIKPEPPKTEEEVQQDLLEFKP